MSVTVVVVDPAFEADAALGGPIDILVDNTAGWPLSTARLRWLGTQLVGGAR